MKYISFALCAAMLLSLTACNDDIFIDPVEIEVSRPVIGWEGGNCEISVNQPGLSVIVGVARIIDGQPVEITDIPTYSILTEDDPQRSFSNSLLGISLSLDTRAGRLSIDIDHNYYSDSILIENTLKTELLYEKARINVLPSPGFSVGEISYNLTSWTEFEEPYISSSYTCFNSNDHPLSYKICAKGQVLASSAGYFTSFDPEISSAIIHDRDIMVPRVFYDPNRLPVLSDDLIRYSPDPQDTGRPVLAAGEDCVIDIPARTARDIKIYVNGAYYGFDYIMTATSPDGKMSVPLTGHYWQRTPVDYYVSVQESAQ